MATILATGFWVIKSEIKDCRSPWPPAIIFGPLALAISLAFPAKESHQIKELNVSKPTAYYAIASDGNLLQKFEDAYTVNKVSDGQQAPFKITRAENIFGLPLGDVKIELVEAK